MSELFGDKLIREAVRIRLHDIANTADYSSEEAAIAALAKFKKSSSEILELKDKLARAIDFILDHSD